MVAAEAGVSGGRPSGRAGGGRRPGDVYSTPGIQYAMNLYLIGLHVRKRWSVRSAKCALLTGMYVVVEFVHDQCANDCTHSRFYVVCAVQ